MKRIISCVLTIVLVLGLVGCGSNSKTSTQAPTENTKTNTETNDTPAPPEDAKYTFKLGTSMDDSHPYSIGSKDFAELVKERTNGQVEIKVFANGQIGSEAELIESLRAGTVDFYVGATASIAGFTQHCYVLDMPFLFKNNEHVDAVLDGDIGEELLDGFSDIGVVGLAWWENGFRNLTNNVRPVVVPEDAEGLKIRVPELPVLMDTFDALGVVVTPMAYNELYMALQQGVVDGQENPISSIYSGKMYEVQKYCSITGHMYSAAEMLISQNAWDSLPEDLQVIVKEAAREVGTDVRALIREFDAEQIALLEENGMSVEQNVDRDAFIEATQAVYDKWSPQMGDLLERIKALEP